jgi:hypothetical protein
MSTTATSEVGNPFVDSASANQDVDDVVEPAVTGFKKYLMYFTVSRFNARLHPSSKMNPATYYFETSISQSAPQFLLRRGDSKMAPMVNFLKLRNSSRHALLGKGDFTKQPEEQLIWEELRREKNLMHSSDYQFGTAEGSVTGRRAEFYWRKNKVARLKTVYDCLDENGRVVARLFSGGAFNWRKGAEIEVLERLDQGLEGLLIMSALAIWASEGRGFRSLVSGFSSRDKSN